MNFFFGIKNSEFYSEIQIPIFQNRNPNPTTNIKLFKAYAENNKWIVEELKNNKINENFFLLNNDEVSNKDIFFLAYKNDLDDFDFIKLKNLFTCFSKIVNSHHNFFKHYQFVNLLLSLFGLLIKACLIFVT